MSQAPTRTPASREPDELVGEIEATRERLAGTIDQIVDRTSPKNVVKRAVGNVKAQFVDQNGSPRTERIAAVAGAVVGAAALIVAIRKAVNR